MKYNLLVLVIFQVLFGYTQKIDLNKSILLIPDSLKQNANLVLRSNHTSVEINSARSMTTHYHKLITVLNKQGDDAFFVGYYDKHTSINNVKITIFDALGKIIKKVKNKEILDVAASDASTLFSDDRYKYYKYTTNKYPYTIEVSFSQGKLVLLHYNLF